MVVKDLQALSIQLEKQKIFETENKKWRKKYENVQKSAKTLSLDDDANFESKIRQIDRQWDELEVIFKEKAQRLASLFSQIQFLSFDVISGWEFVSASQESRVSGTYLGLEIYWHHLRS